MLAPGSLFSPYGASWDIALSRDLMPKAGWWEDVLSFEYKLQPADLCLITILT